MLITLLLFISISLDIIPWIPSLLVENIVNSVIIILYIACVFLVYKFVLNIYNQQIEKKVYKNTFYAIVLLIYIGAFSIMQIGISLTKSTFVESYMHENSIFYVYKDSNSSYEVSLKEKNLPIRSVPIFKCESPITLEMKKNIFDLKTQKSILN